MTSDGCGVSQTVAGLALRPLQCRARLGAHRCPVQRRLLYRPIAARLRGPGRSIAQFFDLGTNRFHGGAGARLSSGTLPLRTHRRLPAADRRVHRVQRGLVFVRRESNARPIRSCPDCARHRRRHYHPAGPIDVAERIPQTIEGTRAHRLGPVQHYALYHRNAGGGGILRICSGGGFCFIWILC